jgi:hypothetical protein
MSTRRERAKTQRRVSEKAPIAVVGNEKDEMLFELGKYCLDLSKLAFGGVVLVNALHFSKENAGELVAGLAFMAGFVLLGSIVVKRATKK